jgi:hypothetical protein
VHSLDVFFDLSAELRPGRNDVALQIAGEALELDLDEPPEVGVCLPAGKAEWQQTVDVSQGSSAGGDGASVVTNGVIVIHAASRHRPLLDECCVANCDAAADAADANDFSRVRTQHWASALMMDRMIESMASSPKAST